MNKLINKKTIYYSTTLFIALFVGFYGGIVDILKTPSLLEINEKLGYPLYFFTLLGVFKILGAIALLLPKTFTKAKEIAYIGFSFDFIFASFSHYSVNDGFLKIIIPLVVLGILSISYYLKNKI